MNCGAIPDVLVENELFGHKQGDYTGAQTDNVGLSTQAQHGTLFLHKVDTLLPKVKIALLRLLQDHSYRPVGAGAARCADVRVFASMLTWISACRRVVLARLASC